MCAWCVQVLSLLFLSPLFEFLPMSTLAVLIVTSLQSLIKVSDAKRFWQVLWLRMVKAELMTILLPILPHHSRCVLHFLLSQVNRQDFYQLAGTFIAVLALGIDVGIMVSISLSCGFLVYRSFTPHLAQLGRVPGSHAFADRLTHDNAYNIDGAVVVRHDGELHFGNKSVLESRLEALLVQAQAPMDTAPAVDRGSAASSRFSSIRGVVLDGSCLPAVDVSGCQVSVQFMIGSQLWAHGV